MARAFGASSHWDDRVRPSWPALAGVAALHVAGLWALLQLEPVRAAVAELAPIMVSLVAAERPPDPPPPPEPVKPRIIAAPVMAPQPQAIEIPEPPPEPEPVAEPAPVEAAPAPIVPPNFVAAYLDNPAPIYPAPSRKLREQGRVLLRVQVTADGRAESVAVERSSGFERLDQAAIDAVRRWKFIPARQGEQPIAAPVIVPVTFELDR